jgi:hypothetical protein
MRITSPKLSFRANEVLILNYYDNLFLIYNFQKEEGNEVLILYYYDDFSLFCNRKKEGSGGKEVLILYYYDEFFSLSVCAQLSTHYDIRTVQFFSSSVCAQLSTR